ncbi:head decoration protein [Methylobacterium sp. E-066]|uniref:head decoration protein n=1 Tax=Methylobacterium sp. E-066 TaxID=2836584 RepID=UPI001FB9970B|nr:head decoration protein [Methylobacterium sp. E-066]MCJ2143730.1 head decoration protein [Methylobacterium sp. E-066]
MTDYAMYDPTSLRCGVSQRDRQITVASGANASGAVLKRGTMLGRVTATDKYVLSVKTANDGSQVPAMVLAFEIDASASDVVCSGYDDGEFVAEKMTFDASWTAATLEAALRAAGSKIYVRSAGVLG